MLRANHRTNIKHHPLALYHMPIHLGNKLKTPICDTDDHEAMVSEMLDPLAEEATPGKRLQDLAMYMSNIHLDLVVPPKDDESMRAKRDQLDLYQSESDASTVLVGTDGSQRPAWYSGPSTGDSRLTDVPETAEHVQAADSGVSVHGSAATLTPARDTSVSSGGVSTPDALAAHVRATSTHVGA